MPPPNFLASILSLVLISLYSLTSQSFANTFLPIPEEESKDATEVPTSSSSPTTSDVVSFNLETDANDPLRRLNDDPEASSDATDFSTESFAKMFRIHKDEKDPSRLLIVSLPSTTHHHFTQFIARVTDISNVVENRFRDANRTFLASLQDNNVINIHGLNPGHQYSIAILGRRSLESTLIREESIVMEPMPLDFNSQGSSIAATSTNITMRANKPERALQDTFRVEYIQLDPIKRYPILDVHDIQEQRSVELYLGNLNPGRDYSVTVTSMRNDLSSQSWKSTITTKPLRPTNLSILEINSTCVQFAWTLPIESGADRFKIAYGPLHGQNNMLRLETLYPEQRVDLCEGILPGYAYIFAVIAEKSRQISEPATLSRVIRPFPPRKVTIEADFERTRFKVQAELPPDEESHAEKCQIFVDSEQQNREHLAEQFVPVIQSDGTKQRGRQEDSLIKNSEGGAAGNNTPTCTAFVDLTPGKRYEISATAISGNVSSTRVLLNRAVEPGFDFATFGLTVKEHEDGTLRIEWPGSDTARLRIADMWRRIVGTDSKLQISVMPWPLNSNDQGVKFESTPLANNESAIVYDSVKQGACYKIHMYTVTGSSGIVSKQRFEEYIRMSPPRVEMALGQIGRNSATVQTFLVKNPPSELRHQLPGTSPVISDDCLLNVLVQDEHKKAFYERSIQLRENAVPTLSFDNLKPFQRYSLSSKVVCSGANSSDFPTNSFGTSMRKDPCPPKIQIIHKIEFQTHADNPGPIRNLTGNPISPFTAQLKWLAPEFSNGPVRHYIVQIVPMEGGAHPEKENGSSKDDSARRWNDDLSKMPWTVNVPTIPTTSMNMQPLHVETVLENLMGGRSYHVSVVASNEAGNGDGTKAPFVQIQMPITSPPRPSLRPELVPNSVHSLDFGVRYNAAMFSEKHGPLSKLAVIVFEVPYQKKGDMFIVNSTTETGDELPETMNGTLLTWSEVQRYQRWPPYIAIEHHPDQATGKFAPKILTETIGNDEKCERVSGSICNGRLKPASSYRIKLRLFTKPTLWTDTFYSEPISTEPLKTDSSLAKLAAVFAFGLCCALIVFALVVAYSRIAATVEKEQGTADTNKRHRTFGVDFSSFSNSHHQRQPKKSNKKTFSRYTNGSLNSNRNGAVQSSAPHPQTKPNKESQWALLKMIMAERAADCLAKLGLDNVTSGHHGQQQQGINGFVNGNPNGGTVIDGPTTNEGIWNTYSTNYSSMTTLPHDQPSQYQNNGLSSPPAKAKREPLRVLGGGVMAEKVATSPNTNGVCLFNSPHHRRSKSLRERTGVDQRLERLPSGPPPGQKTLPWTVIKGQAPPARSRPIRICDFIEHVRIMSADSDFRFSEEYEDLRLVGMGQTSITADQTINRSKNRFTNILPYDHSRVKLKATDDEDGSDYVNASYIPGHNSRREFIAAQGPLPSTRDAFWRLVWEQGTPAIIALTKCVEKGRDKCHQYWPDNTQRSVLYADIEVTLLNESIDYEEFTIRELRLTNFAEPNQQPRTVLHLHYMAWPDFGVPDHPTGIVHFARLFRSKLPPSSANKPTIVHCSAGVGRSGTFIALDRLVQHIECGRPIDVFGIVYEMRLERCFMVQNESQYIFIHHCLQYVLENFFPFLLTPAAKGLTGGSLSTTCSGYSTMSTTTPVNKGSNVFFQHQPSNTNCANGNVTSAASWNGVQNSNVFTFGGLTAPKIEIQQHLNRGFVEDDEGIAESGL